MYTFFKRAKTSTEDVNGTESGKPSGSASGRESPVESQPGSVGRPDEGSLMGGELGMAGDSVYYVLKEVFSNESQTKLLLDIKIPEQYNAKMDKWIEEDYLLMEKDLLSNNYTIYNKY